MKKFRLLAAVLGLGLALGLTPRAEAQTIIPKPQSYVAADGSFTFTAATTVGSAALPDSLRAEAQKFIAALQAASGMTLAETAAAEADVVLAPVADESYGAEAYDLNITTEGITIQARTAAGFFYAFQTLKMLLPRNVMAEKADASVAAYVVPACQLTDAPRFDYRGFMLDCSRHFWTVDELKRMIDVMAYYKLNKFHWHLTDDQGWRFEMPKYPRLTTVGATRQGSYDVDLKYGRYYVSDQYGPYFYTVEQMKDVVAYAAERHIDVVPEIEMPGHMAAAMAAYPEFSCNPSGAHSVWNDGGISTDVLNVADSAAVQFCKDILDELVDIFPYEYIHIGGDECPSTAWESNADCQALYDELGLTSYRQLQSHFTHQLAQYMAQKADPAQRRRLIAWNESITASGSDTQLLAGDDLTIMCWVGADNASNLAEQLGMPTIVTPWPQYYINRKQSTDPDEVHNAGDGSDATLRVVYTHRPQIRNHTIGIQGTFWCEHVSSNEGLEYQALPRLIAIAEVAWTPLARQDFDDFVARLRVDTALLNYGDYTYATHYIVDATDQAKVMPEPGAYYRLVTRASDVRSGRCVQLVREGATIAGASSPLTDRLWSNTPITDESADDYAYQFWTFVEDPAQPGRYAMVCKASPEGSVASANGTATSSRWTYDHTARHYVFHLGEGSYYGQDGTSYYYALRHADHTSHYMNSSLAGQQFAINVYGNPADGNGGLFTFVPEVPTTGGDEPAVESIADGATYRIETTAANLAPLRWTDDGAATLSWTASPWADDAWTATATESADGVQTITLTNATTGRAVSSTTAPVRLGQEAAQLTLTYDADEQSYTIAGSAGQPFVPIGSGYAVNPGTFTPMSGAVVPQGSHWRFVPVVRATFTAVDTDGQPLGTFSQSIELGAAFTPEPPTIDHYAPVTTADELAPVESVTAPLFYTVRYQRVSHGAELRAVDAGGNLIQHTALTLSPDEAQAFTWSAPELPYYTFLQASATSPLTVQGDTIVTLTYGGDALPAFAQRLEAVSHIEDGGYYLIYNNTSASGRSGYLHVDPSTQQIMTSYTVEGTPAHVWQLQQSTRGYTIRAMNDMYIPMLTNGRAVRLYSAAGAEMFTFSFDGTDWTIQGVRNNLYFNGNQGSFTGYSQAHPYKLYKFRTTPYFPLRYTCVTEDGASVGHGTYTFYVRAGETYTLACPVSAPSGYPYVVCSEQAQSGTMDGALDVTYTFRSTITAIDGPVLTDEGADKGPWYELSGRRVSQPTRGVYVRQGEKVVL